MRSAIVFSALVWASWAQASSVEQYGIGFSGPARGLANVAGADDLFATFYNPAGLMEVQAIEFALVQQISVHALSIDGVSNAHPDLTPVLPQTHLNTSVGFAVPLTGRLSGRAALGAFLEVPEGVLVRARSLDARRPHWIFYDSYPEMFVSQVALALRVFKGFDLALGMHNNTGLDGRIRLQVDPARNTLSQRELDFEFIGKVGPTVGLRAQWRQLRLGLVYRSPLAMNYSTPAELAIDDLEAGMELQLAGVAHFLPTVVGLGLEWRHAAWRLEASAQWKDWSSFPDPSIDASIDVTGSDAEQLGLGSALDAPDPAQQPRQSPGLVDVIAFGLGGSWRVNSAWHTHFGYSFIPTPVPEQRHHTNLVDTDRHQLGAGAQWTFKDPFGLFAKPIRLGLSTQWHHNVRRTATKALAAGDPVGSWQAGGHVMSINAGLSGHL